MGLIQMNDTQNIGIVNIDLIDLRNTVGKIFEGPSLGST